MTIETITIASGQDDAAEYGSGTMAVDTANMLLTLSDRRGAWRFQSYAPQGSTVNSATLSVYVNNSSYLAAVGTFYGLNADNIAAWTSNTPTGQISGYGETTASLAWNGTMAVQYYDHDVTDMVQEIFDRPGWTAGNHLGLVYLTGSGVYFRFPQYEGTPSKPAILEIDYTAPASGPPAAAYQQTAQGIALGTRRGL